MKSTFLIAASAAGLFALSASVYAQDMQMSPAQTSAAQQMPQADANAASYGGTVAGSKSMGTASDGRLTSTSSQCTPGLSCNIYQGQ